MLCCRKCKEMVDEEEMAAAAAASAAGEEYMNKGEALSELSSC
jgi:hypothetical protein